MEKKEVVYIVAVVDIDSILKVWCLPDLVIDPPYHPSVSSVSTDNPYYLHTLQGHNNVVSCLAGTGHEREICDVVLDVKRNRCMSGSRDDIVKIWNIKDGTSISTPRW
ncbi:7773_t:CDS:2 [Entrophospora sp. SA101]|nr:7773_t:CDS:2 [Entrophospora sp. SA101]